MKHIKNIPFIPLLLAFTLLSLQTVAQKSIELAYKLKKDQVFNITMETSQTIHMEMMGQEMTINQDIKLFQKAEVLEVDADGNHTLSFSFRRIILDQDAMGMQVRFDSDNIEGADNPMAQQMAATMGQVIDKSVISTIDRFGNSLSTNVDEVLPNGAISGAETGMMAIFPGRSVKPGDSWEVETKMDMQSDMAFINTFTLDEIKNQKAYISFEGKVSGSQVEGKTAEVDGSTTGQLIADLETGWTQSATIRQDMVMEVEENGHTMPMRMSSLIEMRSE